MIYASSKEEAGVFAEFQYVFYTLMFENPQKK